MEVQAALSYSILFIPGIAVTCLVLGTHYLKRDVQISHIPLDLGSAGLSEKLPTIFPPDCQPKDVL